MSMTEEQRLAKNASIKEAMKATHDKRKSQVCRVYMLKVQKNKLSARQKEDFKMLFVEAKMAVQRHSQLWFGQGTVDLRL